MGVFLKNDMNCCENLEKCLVNFTTDFDATIRYKACEKVYDAYKYNNK